MITSLTVSNYRSLGDNVRIDFGQFTALVGPNGSGKSNVMDALRFVADAMQMGLSGAVTSRHGSGAMRRWSGGHPFNVGIHLDVKLIGGTASYRFELTGSSAEEYEVKEEEANVIRGGDRVRFRIERGEWKEGPLGCARHSTTRASPSNSSVETPASTTWSASFRTSRCTPSSPTRCGPRRSTAPTSR